LAVSNEEGKPKAAGGKAEKFPPSPAIAGHAVAGEQAAQSAGQAGGVAIPAAPSGLASLDFELPTDANLYQLYRFSTPRGEAELTARTISASAVARLSSVAAIVVALIVLWLAIVLVRRGALGWFGRPLGATLLLLGGIIMLCGGVLPVIALAGIAAGIWLLIAWLARNRRRVAAA
jgi:hypothetical protein